MRYWEQVWMVLKHLLNVYWGILNAMWYLFFHF